MAQAGYTPIQLYYSTTAAAVPLAANLAQGELAINIADGKLYYENSSGVVTLLAGAGGAGIVAGSNTQLQFNNSGVFGASANLTWDGTTLSSTQINITGQGTLRLQDTTGGEYVGLRSPSALGASYTLTFPADDGTSGQALITDGSGGLSWSTAASGDVYGPASATDNAVARFDSTTGKIIQNSVVIVGDTGDVSGVGTLSAATLTLTNALGTAYGGTGLTSFTSGGVVYASSTSALATGSALTFDGTNLFTTGSLLLGGVSSTGSLGEIGLANSKAIRFRNGANNAYLNAMYVDASNDLHLGAGTSDAIIEVFGLGEAMRIKSTSGNVGIGTSSPFAKLSVTTTNGNFGIANGNTSGGTKIQAFGTSTTSDGYIAFEGYTVEYGRFNTSGNFVARNIGVGSTTPTTSGTGITFPATQSASSDANTLDDYEEGTWTPSLGGTTTYTTQSGQYTKVGRLVNIRCNLQINSIGTGSAFQISGLPFTSATNNGNPTAMVVVGNFQSLALSVIEISAFVGASGTTMNMTGLTAAGASTSTGFSVFGNSARVDLTVTYFTD